jgi:hypothetical protein
LHSRARNGRSHVITEFVLTFPSNSGARYTLMTLGSSKKFAAEPFFVGTLLLLCALAFYYFAVLNIDYRETALLDLGPGPDAVEYFAQARALLKDGWPSIQIGYDKLPSRHPFGYPALMLPWLKILPEGDSILAPFRTNQTLGILFLVGVFSFYFYLGMPLTGGFASILVATLPGFFTFCRSSMSEISGSALIVLAFIFAYLGLKEERRSRIYLSAVFLGLSLSIRIQLLFFAPLLLAAALFPTRETRWHWFFHCVGTAFVFVLAASPVLILNTVEFHSPFKTGYDFWIPYWTEKHRLFSVQNIPINAAMLWSEVALLPKRHNVANIFGTGTYFVSAFVLLICAGLLFVRITRFVICSFLAGFSFVAAPILYKKVDIRFYLPLLILLIAVAVLPVTWAARNIFIAKRTIATISIFVLFAAACLGYPSRSGHNPGKTGRLQAWDAIHTLHFTTSASEARRFLAQKQFLEVCGSESAIVLSDISPVYLNALLPGQLVAAPFDETGDYRFSRIWRYDRPRALALVKRGLDQSRAVYGLFVSKKEMDEKASRLPRVEGHDWIPIQNSTTGPVILKLEAKR